MNPKDLTELSEYDYFEFVTQPNEIFMVIPGKKFIRINQKYLEYGPFDIHPKMVPIKKIKMESIFKKRYNIKIIEL